MEREIKVLDHGYVRYIDSMGSDEAIVEAARMSTGRGFISWAPYRRCKLCDSVNRRGDAAMLHCAEMHEGQAMLSRKMHDWQDFPRGDLGMLEFMWKNKHATPFEFGELCVEVQAPIMVFREWHRHRTQAYSEFSARYSQMPNLHYLPETDRIQKQSTANRQGSGEGLPPEHAASIVDRLAADQAMVYKHYDELCEDGVAKEVARLNTPVSRYSKMRAKTDLRNWLGFLQLRTAPAAQWEIRQFALAVADIVEAIWPRTYALWEEHDRHGVHLSRTEAKALAEFIRTKTASAGDDPLQADAVLSAYGKLRGVA